MTWHVEIRRWDYANVVNIVAMHRQPNGGVGVLTAEPMMRYVADCEAIGKPDSFLQFSNDIAGPLLQALVDALWEDGIRPSQHRDYEKFHDAQGNHLADMRQLVATMSGSSLKNTEQLPALRVPKTYREIVEDL